MVFLMANHRSTRVQGICKKLQTVRGAGWPAAREVVWAAVGDFFQGGRCFSIREGAAEIFWGEKELLFGYFGVEEKEKRELPGGGSLSLRSIAQLKEDQGVKLAVERIPVEKKRSQRGRRRMAC